MASLIKNQILKHLSKFTKNLSPDKLQLSAIKGSCEVTNIELNEEILMELLEIPAWMSLTKAYCNYASIKIQWMKLKTIPIQLLLDEVVIEISTCENFRKNGSETSKANPFEQQGSYGFTQKVIDGISLIINSVNIQFISKIFSASFELTRINIESRNCLWKKSNDLSKTRIRDPLRGEVLLFKHIEWQTLRFVAKSEAHTAVGQAPLRLIANQASCRITMKKRLSNCSLVSGRIVLIFDDLLWVLTDSQLLSALHFADYLGELIKKAPRTKKFDDSSDLSKNNKVQNQNKSMKAKPSPIANVSNNSNVKSANLFSNSISLLFNQHDVKETSHHIIIKRIEVHLMDDLGPHSERSQCPELKEGGALQMSFYKLLIDLYPYHRAGDNRDHWFRYSDPSPHRNSFIMHKLNCFFRRKQNDLRREGSNFNIDSLKSHLISQVLIIRLNDYNIGCVSTNRNSRNASKNSSDSSRLIYFDNSAALPGNVPPIYIEMINYFFHEPYDSLDLPMPEPTPLKINFEPLTIIWINAFFANLRNALLKLQQAFPMSENHSQAEPNVRVEVFMPTVCCRLPNDNDFQFGYDCLELKISKIVLYNCDSYINRDYFRNLDNLIKQFSMNIDFFYEHSEYPWLDCDMRPISSKFIKKVNQLFLSDTNQQNSFVKKLSDHENDLEIDFFSLQIEPLWIEMKSSLNQKYTNVPFLEPINLTLWIDKADELQLEPIDQIDTNIFVRIADPIKIQLNHNQFMFLIRVIEMLGDFGSNLSYDFYMIQRFHQNKLDENLKSDENSENYLLPKNSFDFDQKMIRKIFKNLSVVTHLKEIDLFLILNEKEIENRHEIDSNVDKNSLQESQETDGSEFILDHPLVGNRSSDEIVDLMVQNESIDVREEIVSSTPQCESLDPALNFDRIDDDLVNNGMVLLPKSSSDLNVQSLKHHHHNRLERQLDKIVMHTSFETSSVRMHCHKNSESYENEEECSTLSDFSAEDSDQHSMIALINGECVLDDILADDEPIEEAVDITENLDMINNLDNDSVNIKNLDVQEPIPPTSSSPINICSLDVLKVKLVDIGLIHQSSKGFLSQMFINGSLRNLNEYKQMSRREFNEMIKNIKPIQHQNGGDDDEDSQNFDDNRLILRIDSFNKGTLKEELISIFVKNINEQLDKKTIDSLIEFLQDNITEKTSPMAILMQNVQFKIIDHSVRVPPMLFNIPLLAMSRNKENKWIIETTSPGKSNDDKND
ncbi:UHRF1-binding protein 1-like protein [Sarcoptes scabiei]|uniref:UHRF1-binding protein 1-like protein n=1 Tax=Sarcoptes scabiei TaxID=52283 RepID=A0A132ACE8_SARSC|nr:UHRF1-binding protein 1-like protein [Sarcoptes scabiei]